MTSLFLSYARGDDGEPFDPATSFVAHLHRDLAAAGFDVWFDRVSMPSRSLTFHQEIRDAVATRDRLVLVVGPKAAESLYVRQEWQFAYFEAEKIVTPILHSGDYGHVPDELKLLHCEDFRDDTQYDFHFKNLIRQLAEPAPPLGKLIAVPSLPAHFLSRTERLMVLRGALRADLDRPVVITGAAARVGMHGMGGIGKSVLAVTLSRDRKIREAFPDGIVWVGLGPLPTVADLQRRVHKDLGGDGAFQTEHEGRVKLRDLLKDKGVLLILDDVWRRADVDWFDVLGPRCRAMITTRDAGLLTSLGGVHHQVELLTDAEAVNLLAQAAGVDRDKLPSEAADLIAECGRLPLAVALCGGLIRHGFAWAKVLEQLRTSRIDRIKDPHAAKVEHESIWNAIDVSVKFLSADEQPRFLELAVFPRDEATPLAALRTLWSHTAGFDDWDTDALVIKLSQRSLLELTTADGKAISLHDLVYDYVHRAAGDETALHERLLEAYRKKCPDGWHVDPPNDGYFFTHLRHHLIEAGRGSELADLLQELRWLEAKNEARLTSDLFVDFRDGIGALAADDSRRKILRLLDEALRRHIHFIARHSQDYTQALFQCLWNDCWWYDTPTSARYFEIPEGSSAPWNADEPKLHRLMEQWRTVKLSAQPNFVWIKALSPPPVMLGTPRRLVLGGHSDQVTCVRYSPDGRFVASGGRDSVVRVWDVQSGNCIQELRIPRWVPTIKEGTGKEVLQLTGHDSWVKSLDYSPDGRFLVTGHLDNSVRIWETQGGTEVACLMGHKDSVNCVCYSPDGRLIASAGSNFDKTIRMWESSGWKEVLCIPLKTNYAYEIAFSPDGLRLAVASPSASAVLVFDVATGSEVLRHEVTAFNGVWSVAFSPDGKWLTAGCPDGTSRLIDADTGMEVRQQKLKEMGTPCCCFSPNGSAMAFSDTYVIRLIDAESGVPVGSLEGSESSIESVAFSPDGQSIATGATNGTVALWEYRPDAPLLPRRSKTWAHSCDYSPDGTKIAIGCNDSTVRILDATTGLEMLCLRGHTKSVETVRYSRCGQWLISGANDGTGRLWDAQTGKELKVLCGHRKEVRAVCFYPSGRRVVTAGEDNVVRIWDSVTGNEIICLTGHKDWVYGVDVSPDETRIASASRDNSAILWDAESGKLLAIYGPHRNSATQVCFSADGKFVSTLSNHDQTLSQFEVSSGRQVGYSPANILELHSVEAARCVTPYVLQSNSLGTSLVHNQKGLSLPAAPYQIDRAVANPMRAAWTGRANNGTLCLLALEPAYSKNPKGGRIYLIQLPASGGFPDNSGRAFWFFFHVWKKSPFDFEQVVLNKSPYNPGEYGEIIDSGYGDKPPASTIQTMRDERGFLD